MMHVEERPEPKAPGFDFDGQVRKPGLSALSELTGGAQTTKRRGPHLKKLADKIEDLDPAVLRKYAYWTRALDALHAEYRGICAYTCFYIEPTGGRTVDHFVAITKASLQEAYEWDNYRLACSLMNTCKGAFTDVVDPFEVQDGWFVLNLYTLEVEPGASLDEDTRERVVDTITRLKLNESDCKLQRQRYFDLYWQPKDPSRPIPLWFFEEQAPFLAREMRRQGRVRPEDGVDAIVPSGHAGAGDAG